MLQDLNYAFFGKSEDTGFESVSSYYKKASYGKLSIEGEVTTPLVSAYESQDYIDKGMNAPGIPAEEFYEQADASLLKDYDQDGDGYIDAIELVYSNDYLDHQVPYWAWTSCFNTESNVDKPWPHKFTWASYSYMGNGQYADNKVDAHTYIHETGHLFGLSDYYCTYGSYNPLGDLSMMDHNVLDFDAYSKMCLGWSYPYVIKDSTSITIKPFEDSGECILVADNWNGSPMDEYLLIEYYTPTGLNEKDSEAPYPYNNCQGFTKNGIKIYHVDARIAKVITSLNSEGKNTYSFGGYESLPDLSKGLYTIGANNSVADPAYGNYYTLYNYTDAELGRYKEIHLMEAGGSNTFIKGFSATNDTLFTEGSSFSASKAFFTYGSKWNNHSYCDWTINVTSLSSTGATLSITRG
jgi:M6 family metalloprotease-like protein